MKTHLLTLVITLVFFASCKQTESESKEKFFPVLSFIQSQVAEVDTSLYSIRQLIYVDSLRTDTVYIPREKFREVAADFLSIPDLSQSEFAKRYTEEKMFDETLNTVLLTYIPVNPAKEEIQRQEVLIRPNPDQVTNIIINLATHTRDSAVQKRLLWKVDESFQVVTTKQMKGQPETTSTVKVEWAQ